jgi:hypothetical protein
MMIPVSLFSFSEINIPDSASYCQIPLPAFTNFPKNNMLRRNGTPPPHPPKTAIFRQKMCPPGFLHCKLTRRFIYIREVYRAFPIGAGPL